MPHIRIRFSELNRVDTSHEEDALEKVARAETFVNKRSFKNKIETIVDDVIALGLAKKAINQLQDVYLRFYGKSENLYVENALRLQKYVNKLSDMQDEILFDVLSKIIMYNYPSVKNKKDKEEVKLHMHVLFRHLNNFTKSYEDNDRDRVYTNLTNIYQRLNVLYGLYKQNSVDAKHFRYIRSYSAIVQEIRNHVYDRGKPRRKLL